MSWFNVFIVILLWHGASGLFIANTLGDKYRKPRWYDYPLGFPVMFWITIFVFVKTYKRNDF